MDGMKLLKFLLLHFPQMQQALHSRSIKTSLLVLSDQNHSNGLVDLHSTVLEELEILLHFSAVKTVCSEDMAAWQFEPGSLAPPTNPNMFDTPAVSLGRHSYWLTLSILSNSSLSFDNCKCS
jgi:hypothetical protein